ncbi:MAG: hypothetical protein AMXMBFR12_01480 [Candidatus Babeliales bacterium]
MKLFLKALGLLALFSGSLLHGYAIVFDKNSPVPFVDIYVYNVNSPSAAAKRHANYVRLMGLPDQVIKGLEAAKGPVETLGTLAAGPTGGLTADLGTGYAAVVGAGKTGMNLFDKPVKGLLGRAFRSDDDAFHENVWRGNRGRGAEWKTEKTMYAIVTMPNNLLPLNEPVLLPTRGVTGFNLVSTGDAKVPYRAQFNSSLASQYISAETDKRDKKEAKELAKTSGERAFNGQ